MKSELLYTENFESPEAFIKALDKYIEYYNNKRIKARLNGKRLSQNELEIASVVSFRIEVLWIFL